MIRKLCVGTRGSLLARKQTAWVIEQIRKKYPGCDIQEIVISTKGDLCSEIPIPEIGGKGFFTKELEKDLIEGKIDFAVHSLKDLPTELLPGLCLGGIPVRANPMDVLVTRDGADLKGIKPGDRVGTSSFRRMAQILYCRPDLHVVGVRGNLGTRLRKLETGEIDALILAAAGLERLDLEMDRYRELSAGVCLPAPGQGALAVEIRESDELMRKICLTALEDPPARQAITAERALLKSLGGGCQAPVGALAVLEKGRLRLRGQVIQRDGSRQVSGEIAGDSANAVMLGESLALDLINRGAKEILAIE